MSNCSREINGTITGRYVGSFNWNIRPEVCGERTTIPLQILSPLSCFVSLAFGTSTSFVGFSIGRICLDFNYCSFPSILKAEEWKISHTSKRIRISYGWKDFADGFCGIVQSGIWRNTCAHWWQGNGTIVQQTFCECLCMQILTGMKQRCSRIRFADC